MELAHTFTVPASMEDTWAAFNDIESVGGCFPGATVTSVEGDEFKGSCKVKLGPIALVYSGSGRFVERDDAAHRFVIEAKGKDKRGNGTAGATVTVVLAPAGSATDTSATPTSATHTSATHTSATHTSATTEVEVSTDLAITGKPAQFGRGVIQEVSDKLLQQFVDCLGSKVVASGDAAAGDAASGGKHAAKPVRDATPTRSDAGVSTAAAGPGAGARKAPASTYSGASAGADPAGEAPQNGVAQSGATQNGVAQNGVAQNGVAQNGVAQGGAGDALDLGATVLPVLLRSYWRQIAGGLIVLLVLRKLFGRR